MIQAIISSRSYVHDTGSLVSSFALRKHDIQSRTMNPPKSSHKLPSNDLAYVTHEATQ